MYVNALRAAGLDHKQAAVYLACLSHGPSKVPEIAREAGIKRTTAYGIVDELVSLGLVRAAHKGKRKLYQALDPRDVLNILDERREKFLDALPGLSDLFLKKHTKPQIHFFEGREGIKKVHDDILACASKKVRQIVRVRDHIEALGESFTRAYIQKRVAKGIEAYDLHPKYGDVYTLERGTESAAMKRHVRYLPANVFHAAMIMIYDHKVAMVSTKAENFGFIIESKEFSNTLSAYFDFMWGLGSREPDIE